MEETPHRTPKLVEVRFTKWVKALIELAVRLNGSGEQRWLDKKGGKHFGGIVVASAVSSGGERELHS
jgi:hypothetical protein